MKRIVALCFSISLLIGLVSCREDAYLFGNEQIGKGESCVTFGLTFRPLSEVKLGGSRGEKGDIIKEIHNLFVVWYDATSGELKGSTYLDTPVITEEERPAEGSRPENDKDSPTQHTEFTYKIPYGKYRFYAAANMGDLTNDPRIHKEADFKAISLTWNAESVASNNQMSGYFAASESTAYAKGDADEVTINQGNISLHCWLRRAASKVTVAFDASALNENIYIYLQSAQIKDIPVSCPLVNANTPASAEQLIAEGDKIIYGEGDFSESTYTSWPRLAKGNPHYPKENVHGDDAESLFFYENMQGTGENKHQYQNFDSKDNKPYGTYLEVKGYYVNHTDNPSYGPIVYRCMLGKNMTDNFDAERNVHYRVTLKFNEDANDPDWHIEFEYIPKPPRIVIPTPQYISYQYDRSLDIPVTILYNKAEKEVISVTAQILENAWYYPGHKYDHVFTQPYNGYLSLYYNGSTAVTDNQADWQSGIRTFDKNSTVKYPETSADTPVAIKVDDYVNEQGDNVCRFHIPVHTRPLGLEHGLSGQNIYVGAQIRAKVKFTVTLQDKRTGEQTTLETVEGLQANPNTNPNANAHVSVIQVRRIVNPAGIWREQHSTKPFKIAVQVSPMIDETTDDFHAHFPTEYEPLVSYGPWKAEVIGTSDGTEWVQLSKDGSADWGTTVTGSTGSDVVFHYKPREANPSSTPRFGTIRLTYHDNQCYHLILVSQGYGITEINNVKWHMSNVVYKGKDAENPLLEGCMFKFGQEEYPLLSRNNKKDRDGNGYGYGFDVEAIDSPFEYYYNNTDEIKSDVTFRQIKIDSNPTFAELDYNGSQVASYDDWQTLIGLERIYGVLYGEECEETIGGKKDMVSDNKGEIVVAAGYTNVGDPVGMITCFVLDTETNKHLMFPMGNTGYGRRKQTDQYYNNPESAPGGKVDEAKYGTLKYADRTYEMPQSAAQGVPSLYYLYHTTGAIYWYRQRHTNPTHYGFDINFMTYGFTSYTSDHVYENSGESDAAFVRMVEK